MSVVDKSRVDQQARRVLVIGGRLAIWDIIAGAHPVIAAGDGVCYAVVEHGPVDQPVSE
jgi:hypothetical protein